MKPHKSSSLEQTLVQLFDHLPMVVFYQKDKHGSFIRCNPRFEEFHGKARGEALGLTDFDLHHPTIASRYRAEDRKIMESGHSATNRIWLVPGAKGLLRWWISNKFPTYDASGRINGVAGVMYEISGAVGMIEPFARIEPALNLIHAEHPTTPTTCMLAAACHLSESQFNRIFRNLTGQSPRQYILLHKIETAKDLLCRTDQSLSQIALRCGFYDASDFGKRFGQAERMTPRQYRNRQKEFLHALGGKLRKKVAHP